MVDVLEAEFRFSLPRWQNYPETPQAQVCFCGRSNVGKSSLLNCLAGRKSLARVSSTPGRTQALNVFSVALREAEERRTIWFVDLPGYGYANAPASVRKAWRPMMEGYLRRNPMLRAAVLLLDIRRKPNEGDLDFLEMLERFEVPVIPVVTKTDKVPSTKRRKSLRLIADTCDIPANELRVFSSVTRHGRDELLGDLFDLAEV